MFHWKSVSFEEMATCQNQSRHESKSTWTTSMENLPQWDCLDWLGTRVRYRLSLKVLPGIRDHSLLCQIVPRSSSPLWCLLTPFIAGTCFVLVSQCRDKEFFVFLLLVFLFSSAASAFIVWPTLIFLPSLSPPPCASLPCINYQFLMLHIPLP